MTQRLETYPWSCFHQVREVLPVKDFHRHNEIELTLLRAGQLDYQMNGETVPVPVGRLCLFWGGIPHRWLKWSRALNLQVICLPMDFVAGLELPPLFLRSLLRGRLLRETDRSQTGLDDILMARWEKDLGATKRSLGDIARLEIEARLKRLALNFASVQHAPRGGNDALSRLLGVLCASATSGEGVKALATEAGLHPKYAMRLFKKACGVSMLSYLHQLRIGHAQRLLATSDQKIVDITYACGFSSSTQFFAVFKRLARSTPSHYRAVLRGDREH